MARSALRSHARFVVATSAAGLSSVVSRRFGHYGTALPGLVAERIDRTILARLARDVDPVVVVLGTNGKTTTTRLLARILDHETGRRSVTNRSGANLRQGIVTSLIDASRRRQAGSGRAPAVFEVDELAFAGVAAALRPAVVVILNLLRDQLDRYGEIDAIEERWVRDLASLPASTTLVICGDDPRLESVGRRSGREVRRFGIWSDERSADGASGSTSGPGVQPDSSPCPDCGTPVEFASPAALQLGDWRCGSCGSRRVQPDLLVRPDAADPAGWLGLAFEGPALGSSDISETVHVRLTGSAGAYDAAAAVLAASTLGIDQAKAIDAIDRATPAFGRLEEIDVGDRRVVLTLAKNPASLAQAAEATEARRPDGLLIGLGDRPADGRDVSWIWDGELESLAPCRPLVITGTRADDLALRFKYGSDVPGSAGPRPYFVDRDVGHALDVSLREIGPGGTLMVVATYTPLLAIRRLLERRGAAPAFPR